MSLPPSRTNTWPWSREEATVSTCGGGEGEGREEGGREGEREREREGERGGGRKGGRGINRSMFVRKEVHVARIQQGRYGPFSNNDVIGVESRH